MLSRPVIKMLSVHTGLQPKLIPKTRDRIWVLETSFMTRGNCLKRPLLIDKQLSLGCRGTEACSAEKEIHKRAKLIPIVFPFAHHPSRLKDRVPLKGPQLMT